jgi:2-polyprenyl-3-methyl-5-hydroxy-6-metoxy-1,4-benzoquinol methylase
MKINPNLNSLDKIYTHYKFNPVGHKLNKKELKMLMQQRKSLLQDYLKIPFNFFKNKQLLEIGAASGEKTFIYGLLGSKITVVEPNKSFVKKLRENFKKKAIKAKIFNTYISEFKTNKKYDFIVMENFLTSIKGREKYLKKIQSYLNDNGFIIFSYHNKIGFFLEYFRYYVLQVYLLKNKITNLNEALIICRKFFLKEFKKTNTTRSFDQYALDTLILNNFLDKTFWDFKSIVKIANQKSLRFYSSWPNYLINRTEWHKKILKTSEYNLNVYKDYLFNEKSFISQKINFNESETEVVRKILNMMIKNKNDKEFGVQEIINLISNDKKIKKVTFFKNICKILKNNNPLNYNKVFNYSDWGFPNHYVVFTKDN